jgi:hypothetical protein
MNVKLKIKNSSNTIIYLKIKNDEYLIHTEEKYNFIIKKFDNIEIAWKNCNNEFNIMVKQQQEISGIFKIYNKYYRSMAGPPQISFETKDTDSDVYSDNQYKIIGDAMKNITQCKCYKMNCPCLHGLLDDNDLLIFQLKSFVSRGFITEKQLKKIISDML